MYDQFDGFSIMLLHDEMGDWIAYFSELNNVSACGDNPEEAIHELAIAWEAMKESYRQHNEPIPIAPAAHAYSGQFNVRIDKRIHKQLAIEAAQAGISLNALVAQKLALAVAKKAA
jgi:predicted HicB family RNase H-like nuclease